MPSYSRYLAYFAAGDVVIVPPAGGIDADSSWYYLPIPVGSVYADGSLESVEVGGDVEITPPVGSVSSGAGHHPATFGAEVLPRVKLLVPDPGFATVYAVEIDWDKTEEFSRYASVDCEIEELFYDGRVADDNIPISRQPADDVFGTIRIQDVKITLKNGDGGLDDLFGVGNENGASYRNSPMRLKVWDFASGYLNTEFYGVITQILRDVDQVQLVCRDIDSSILDKQIPGGKAFVDSDRFPLAQDEGALIPLCFGETAKVPCRNIIDDKETQTYKYIQSWGLVDIVQFYRLRNDKERRMEKIKPTLTPFPIYTSTLEWPLMLQVQGSTNMLRDTNFGCFGADRAIIVIIMLQAFAAETSAVRYGTGVLSSPDLDPGALSASLVGSESDGTTRIEIWAILAPPEGVGILQVEWGDSPQPSFPGVIAISLANASQEIGDYGFAGNSGTSNTATVPTTSVSGDVILSACAAIGRKAEIRPGEGQVELATANVNPAVGPDPGDTLSYLGHFGFNWVPTTSPNSATFQAGGEAVTPTWRFYRHRNSIMTVQQFATLYADLGFSFITIGGVDVLIGPLFPPDVLTQVMTVSWVAASVVVKGPPAYEITTDDDYTYVQFRRRQQDANGNLLQIFGDVVEQTLNRNVAMVIRECLVNDRWGPNAGPVDEATFTAQGNILLAIPLYCDGAIVDQPLRLGDVLEQLLFMRGIFLTRNEFGWTIIIDQPPEEIALVLSAGEGQLAGDQPTISFEPRRVADLNNRTSRVILSYRFDYTRRNETPFLNKIQREVFGDPGREQSKELLLVRDHGTADQILSYRAFRELREDDQLPAEFSVHARALREGSVVELTYPRLGYTQPTLLRVGANTLNFDSKSVTLFGYDLGIFAYIPSVPFPPADSELGDLLDFSDIPPDPATGLQVIRKTSIVNPTSNETITVVIGFTTPTENFGKAILKYQQIQDLTWTEYPAIEEPGTHRVIIQGLIPLAVYNFTVQILNPYGLKSFGDPILDNVGMPGHVPIKPVLHGRKA